MSRKTLPVKRGVETRDGEKGMEQLTSGMFIPSLNLTKEKFRAVDDIGHTYAINQEL